ncbi:MAG: threonylcarbamoyl-AMP synthase [Eubacterium sp.]|nr:threonylcarbamoyl-AMP synthase [Eubacterium sp.]
MKQARVVHMTEEDPDLEALTEAGRILRHGGLVAFPTETVYGLGGNALDPEASRKIYAAKGRPSDNPLIVHIADQKDLDLLAAVVPEKAKILIQKYWPGPLTVILPKSPLVPYETTGGLDTVAVRFPDNRIARELIKKGGGYVAAPSANRSGRPSPTRAEHVEEDLGYEIDMILDGGPVRIGLESTIVDFTEDVPVVLRPGYIGLEMLRQELGEVRMDPGLTAADPEQEQARPKAPGMKYRHYAPEGDLIIVEGEPEEVYREIRKRVHRHLQDGNRAGVICTEESRAQYPEGDVLCIGKRSQEESIARNLYEILREFDEAGTAYMYSESFYTPKMGQAIMNRLLKAAGGNVIHVDE